MHLYVLREALRLEGRENRGERSAAVSARVTAARQRAVDRQGDCNARLSAAAAGAGVTPALAALLESASARLGLSHRAAYRVLRVALTIADLAACDHIESEHLLEALSLRCLDRSRP